jgi:hypothetical protein
MGTRMHSWSERMELNWPAAAGMPVAGARAQAACLSRYAWVVQVQEAGLKWRVSIAECTVMHLGPALLPFRPRILKVLAGLFAAPSKVGGRPSLTALHGRIVT